MASFRHRRWITKLMADNESDEDITAYQSEIKAWCTVNHLLQCQGFAKIQFSHPEDTSAGELVCLDIPTSESLREILTSLLGDTTADVSSMMNKYQTKVDDLKVMLECSRARVQELEDQLTSKSLYMDDEGEVMRNKQNMTTTKHRHLERKCEEQKLEMDALKKKLNHMMEEESRRMKRQNQVFLDFKKRTARAHSVMDERLLDVIDAYERQIGGLKKKLDGSRSVLSVLSEDNGEICHSVDDLRDNPSQNMRSVIKTYEKKLHNLQNKVKNLEKENEVFKLDMGSKPEMKEYRQATQRIRKLEKLLSVNNVGIPGENTKKDPFRVKRKYSSKIEDIDCLPLDFCQQYLKDISCELGVDDINKISRCIQSMNEEINDNKRFEGFCRHVHNILQKADRQGHVPGKRSSRMSLTDRNLHLDTTVLENWANDIVAVEDLPETLNQLLARLAPWAKVHLSIDHSIDQMIDALESVAVEESPSFGKNDRVHLSRTVMENIVEHFMMLFDVPTVAGVFPRMNEVYTKLGEVHNVMHSLRIILGLEDDSKSSDVVDSVGRLCQAHNSTTAKQLKQLLQTDDLDGVIRRLDEHRNFFPAFKELTKKLIQILNVERMDQIVPAVRALKMLSH